MKIKLAITKRGTTLYEDVHEIADAESFGEAFATVWARIEEQRLQKTTSIGELMDVLNEDVLEEMNGAEVHIEKI